MNNWGHRGVSLATISSGGIVLLGADLVQPTLLTILALYGCLSLGVVTAALPNTLETLTGLQRRGLLHSVLTPISFVPVVYLLVLGTGAQLQRIFAQTLLVPPSWDILATFIAGTTGGVWLLHIAVDSGAYSRGTLSLRPFAPLSERIVSANLYQSDSRLVNWCALIVGTLMAVLLTVILIIQVSVEYGLNS
ncbi:hypothetical protein [Halarchaeum grantii]|uniref:hypothetical protein n=1 Tax=Halarchaeum grantii TaxID=1193105 RepID=UPI0016635004|nr:hypothetical protein [Halarchaeum grantii]